MIRLRKVAAVSLGRFALLLGGGRFFWILGVLSLPVLVCGAWAAWNQMGFFPYHDEAEHLFVVFALERGEVPYRHFIENHPVLFHLILLGLKQLFGATQAIHIYWLGKGFSALHVLFAFAVLAWVVSGLGGGKWRLLRGGVAVAISLALSGVWGFSEEWIDGHTAFWHLRPDWIVHAYALLCVVLHYRWHRAWIITRRHASMWPLVLAGFFGGLATAILPKTVYLFLPYLLTWIVVGVDCVDESLVFLRGNWRRYLVANIGFVLIGFATYCAVVVLELKFTGGNFFEYQQANFALNSIKHMPALIDDFNPINLLRSIFGLNTIAFVLLALYLPLRGLHLARREMSENFAAFVFCVLVIGVNVALPAFTNGLSWPHYFIPSLLAWCMLVSGLLLSVERKLIVFNVAKTEVGVSGVMLVVLVAVLMVVLVLRGQSSFEQAENVAHQGEMRKAFNLNKKLEGFVPDEMLPDDLSYLVFDPRQKPVAARVWGYFFMLSTDRMLWSDAHRIGIAPDPESYWRELFDVRPPDVVMLSGESAFLSRKEIVYKRQGVDISWLWPRIQKDYVCVVGRLMRFHVRHQLQDRFEKLGFGVCHD